MIDYVYNTDHTALYKVRRYFDGEIELDIRLLETYRLAGDKPFEEFDSEAFFAERTAVK